MTLGDFRNILVEYVKAGQASFVDATDTASLNLVIDRGLKSFARFTFSIYTSTQTLAISASTSVYDMSPMFHVDCVSIGSNMIYNRDGDPGLESRFYLQKNYPDYVSRTQYGTPGYVIFLPRKQIEFVPIPDVSGTAYLAGFCEHTTITSGSVDSTILQLEDSYADLAALWVSFLLKIPHAEGSELFNQIMAKDQFAAKRLDNYAMTNKGQMIGPGRRGKPLRQVRW